MMRGLWRVGIAFCDTGSPVGHAYANKKYLT